ncbi:hypothetical protein [Nocardia sp. BMG51109]|uniref:hypothetical protein n=1 Tax=Nocardia sp. BMG51109 TaxID=1056816 RepID=UPI0018DDFD9B|nr:hypothetical protein [Nocardia sp. BMG51109]
MTFSPAVRADHIVHGVTAVVEGHAALRLRFSGSAENGYEQEVLPCDAGDIAMELLDVADADEDRARRYIDTLLRRDATEWDPSRRGVYYFRVVKIARGRHCLAISLRSAALDGYSVKAVIAMLRDAVLDFSRGIEPAFAPDRYRAAVEATLPTEPEERAARRYWKRELGLLPEAFGSRDPHTAAPVFLRSATVAGDDYRKIRDSGAGESWGAATVFLRRLLEVWRDHRPGPCLIDTHFGSRPRGFGRQIGMFSTVRPLVLDLDDDAWHRRVGAKLMRAAAHQNVDSIALRRLEEERGIRQRPFPHFDFVHEFVHEFADDFADEAAPAEPDDTSALESSNLSLPPMASLRPVGVHVTDTGNSFVLTASPNAESFSPADADRLVQRLVAG